MTSAELKHRAKLQEWSARIQDCRSSGLSVRARYHATLRNVPQRCILETPVWTFTPVVTRNS